MRSIRKIETARKVNMGGLILDQPLPFPGVNNIDPFLLVHHWANTYPGKENSKDLGVPPHPHRGFSPVTFIFKGDVHHQDSRGYNQVVTAGGTQWMDSGMGIVHSERPSQELAENGGEFEIIQFWVNSPAEHKIDEPRYQPLTEEATPFFKSEDGLVTIGIVAGEANGVKGPIKTYSEINALRGEIKTGGKHSFSIPKEHNVFLYQLDGRLLINNEKRSFVKDLIWFSNDDSEIMIEALSDTRFILLSGKPLNEKINAHGPFVMNEQTEILEAIRDYQQGKMGVLIEEF